MEQDKQARLLAFEQMHADFLQEQTNTLAELDRLRAEGKERTVRFRELLGEKLLQARLGALFQKYGL